MHNHRVNVRLASVADAGGLLKIYAPYVLETPVTFEEEVPSVTGFAHRIRKITQHSPYLICEVGSRIVGYAYATEFRARSAYRFSRELSVYIDSEFQRNGLAIALCQTLFQLLKMQHVRQVISVITLPNEASVKLHEKMGFTYCGAIDQVGLKLGKWYQVGWWQLDLMPERQLEWVSFRKIEKQSQVTDLLTKLSLQLSHEIIISHRTEAGQRPPIFMK